MVRSVRLGDPTVSPADTRRGTGAGDGNEVVEPGVHGQFTKPFFV